MPRFNSLSVLLLISTGLMAQETTTKGPVAESTQKETGKPDWKPLFNGKDLDGWKVTNFGGEGEVSIEENETVVIRQGADLSGITSTRDDLPTTNYEVEFDAQRAVGGDFFVGFTFPVAEESCTLILGGWGGGVCGLSSLDNMDASENSTTWYDDFTRGKWYKVRVRVTDELILAWIDDKEMVRVERGDYKVGVRFEMEVCKPMGFATYQTVAHIRNARLRPVGNTDADLSEQTKADN